MEDYDIRKYRVEIAELLSVKVDDVDIVAESTTAGYKGFHWITRLKLFGSHVAHGYLIPMPGCCGVIVSTEAYVNYDQRGKGIGDVMHRLRIELAADRGYTCMICTDITANEPQAKIIKKNGWKLVHDFNNKRTANPVSIHVRAV
ncbi:unnamed protein product [marine sediment metagenome]|uniref:N-acetyltransferase domain-containing protein n=1 Tax=marine sediment metagenome TaxID=412755 RepID=X1L9U9_9ZZZZ